jgi:hypothetical protein
VSRRVVWFRVLGMGEISAGTAYAYLWATEPASASWSLPSGCVAALTYPTLLGAPSLPSSEIAALDTIGGDGGLSVEILHGPESSNVLVRGEVTSFTSSGGSARLTQYAEPGDVTLNVDDSSGFTSLPRLAYSGREAFVVTAVGSGTLTVTRGACGSIPQPYPMTKLWSTYVGAAIYSGSLSPVGLWCEVGISEYGGAATVLWRGVVESVEVDSDHKISVSARSLLADLRERVWIAPRATRFYPDDISRVYRSLPIGSDGGTFSGSLVKRIPGELYILVDADQWGDTGDAQWQHARVIHDDGRWVVIPITYDATNTAYDGVRYASYLCEEAYVPSEIVQVGDDTGPLDLPAGELALHVQAVLGAKVSDLSIEYARVAQGSAASVLNGVLSSVEPVGWSGAIPSAWLDLDAISLSAGLISPPTNTLDGNTWCHSRPKERKILDALSTDLLAPLAYGLVGDAGSIVGIDWTPDARIAATTVGSNSARSTPWRWSRRGWEGNRAAVLVQGRAEAAFIVSGRADPRGLLSGVQTIAATAWADSSIAEGGPVLQRQNGVVALYSQVIPVLSCEVDVSVAPLVGTVVQVTRPDLVTQTGGVGSPACRGLIIERARALSTDVVAIRVLLIGWVDDPALAWAPSGLIVSGTATTAVIEAAEYSSDDLLPWAQTVYPAAVKIVDALGDTVDTGTATAFNTGTETLTISGLGGAPSAGQIVQLTTYGAATTANQALWVWLADTDGTVGSAAGYPWGA